MVLGTSLWSCRREGLSVFLGSKEPCPFSSVFLLSFYFLENMGRRCCYRISFWQELGKM